MPASNKLYFTRKASDSSIAGEEKQDGTLQLITINPLTMEREVLASNLPEGWFQFTPDEKTLIYTLTTEGRKKDPQVYDVKEPEDRQPGWRERSNLAKYDLASGILQPLTFGYHNIYLMDISADSRYLLIGKGEERLTKRPTTLTSFYRLDLGSRNASGATTPKVETLIEKGEFLNSAQFSPDGKKVILGLVTSKSPVLEDKATVIARIREAARYIPLDRLSLSPQCGFASCEIGNKLTDAEQWAKIDLVREISEEVWG